MFQIMGCCLTSWIPRIRWVDISSRLDLTRKLPIYDQLCGERINADVPGPRAAVGRSPERGAWPSGVLGRWRAPAAVWDTRAR